MVPISCVAHGLSTLLGKFHAKTEKLSKSYWEHLFQAKQVLANIFWEIKLLSEKTTDKSALEELRCFLSGGDKVVYFDTEIRNFQLYKWMGM